MERSVQAFAGTVPRLVALVTAAVVCMPLTATAAPRDSAPLILVTGATGTQGGAVARELLRRGYRLRGLTRHPAGERAQALARQGITMVAGDFAEPDSLARAMQGAYGVFAVTDFWEHGYAREVAHGKAIVDAAKRAGIRHLVYTSVASADQATGIPHFDSKYEIEEYLAASGVGWSVVRPVSFMDNWRWRRDEILAGEYRDPGSPAQRQQWIAASDIGFFVAEAFDHPDQWLGRAVEIAGDELTLAELATVLSDVTGRPVRPVQIPWAQYEAENGPELTRMHRWFASVGYTVDVRSLRERYPDLVTARQYLEQLFAVSAAGAADHGR